MTREEAVKILKEERWYMSRYSEEYKEAYDMAIEALMTDIVRCGECKFYKTANCHMDNIWELEAHDFCSYGERAEQTEYKLPGHDEVTEALEKLTIRKVTDKEKTEYLNRTFGHDDGEWHDLTDTLTESHGRLIDADTVVTVQVFDEMYEEYNLMTMTIAEALDLWTEEGCPPTVQAVPRSLYENLILRKDRPNGEWLDVDNEPYCECSECGVYIDDLDEERCNFCPNCGAQMDMRGESEKK